MDADIRTILFACLVGLMLADASLTIRAIRNQAEELNPVLRYFIRLWGIRAGVIVPKVVVLWLVLLNLPDLPVWALAAMVACYFYWAMRGFNKS